MKRLESILTIVMVCCALVAVGFYVRQELGYGSPQAGQSKPRRFDDWERVQVGGLTRGPDGAKVIVVVFSDFQCPFCRTFAKVLTQLEERHSGDVKLVFHNFPVSQTHPHAFSAALGAVCAYNAGRFSGYHDAVFERQDSIGILPWSAIANRSGIADSLAFLRCMDSESPRRRVVADSTLGASIGLSWTPTVIVNGWAFSGTPTVEQIEKVLK
jgi:protein-disulfide isomerase